MAILISNDDGVNAEGIRVLADTLSSIYEIKVVAPDRDHSGASGSLTLSRPLRVTSLSKNIYCVDGTPADSAHIGLGFPFENEGVIHFERLVSGINSHENLGDDVLYSGTVAAAIEGRFLSQPAIAVSLVNRGNFLYQTAARVIMDLLSKEIMAEFPLRTLLNVNVPDIPYEELKGVKVTRLGYRAKGQSPEMIQDPRGRERYWIAAAGEGEDVGEDTDFYAVEHDFVSITPVQVDMTRYDVINKMKAWLED